MQASTFPSSVSRTSGFRSNMKIVRIGLNLATALVRLPAHWWGQKQYLSDLPAIKCLKILKAMFDDWSGRRLSLCDKVEWLLQVWHLNMTLYIFCRYILEWKPHSLRIIVFGQTEESSTRVKLWKLLWCCSLASLIQIIAPKTTSLWFSLWWVYWL